MPSGRDFIVERVAGGQRHVLWSTYHPGSYLILEEEDHVHFLVGPVEELAKYAPEVNATLVVSEEEEPPKPKRKPTARKAK